MLSIPFLTSLIALIGLMIFCKHAHAKKESSSAQMRSKLILGLKSSIENEVSKRGNGVDLIDDLYDESEVVYHSVSEKQAILDKHNEFRSQVNPAASNMEYMVWNEDLAYLAGLWATICYWGHGQPDHDKVKNFPSIGQSLYMDVTGGEPNGVDAVTDWYNKEVNHFNYETNTCNSGRVCGHYLQVVWAKTTEVGCARAHCPSFIDIDGKPFNSISNKWIEACNYAPRKNYPNTKPYRSGESCTQCQSGIGQCYDNLCRLCSDHNEVCDCQQVCHNGATKTSECKCLCASGWYDVDCSKECKDYDDKCGNGWPPLFCHLYPDVKTKCPKMCGVCV